MTDKSTNETRIDIHLKKVISYKEYQPDTAEVSIGYTFNGLLSDKELDTIQTNLSARVGLLLDGELEKIEARYKPKITR